MTKILFSIALIAIVLFTVGCQEPPNIEILHRSIGKCYITKGIPYKDQYFTCTAKGTNYIVIDEGDYLVLLDENGFKVQPRKNHDGTVSKFDRISKNKGW